MHTVVTGTSLLARIAEFNLAEAPAQNLDPVGSNDKVIGTLSPILQGFSLVLREIGEEAFKLRNEARLAVSKHAETCTGENDEACKAILKQFNEAEEAMNTANTVKSIFWKLVKMDLPDANGCRNLGIREGFTLVAPSHDASESEGIKALLDLLMGVTHPETSMRGRASFES